MDIPKTWVLTGKNFEESRRKKNTSSLDQTIQWNTRPQNHQLNKALVSSNNQNKQNLRKAFRSELLELCKTRNKKSSPDKINFYVVFAGQDMVTDKSRATKCRCNLKAHHYKQNIQKKGEGHSENMGFDRRKMFEAFRRQKTHI